LPPQARARGRLHCFVLGRRLHRKVSRLLASKDAIDVAGRAPELADVIGPIGDQAAVIDEETEGINRGQSVLGRKFDKQTAMDLRRGAPSHDQAAIRLRCEELDSALDFTGIAHIERP
jgi:hypothetical protein